MNQLKKSALLCIANELTSDEIGELKAIFIKIDKDGGGQRPNDFNSHKHEPSPQ